MVQHGSAAMLHDARRALETPFAAETIVNAVLYRSGKEGADLQGDCLKALCAKKCIVAVYLVSGIRLIGTVQCFDRYTLLLAGISGQQLVYKHAVASIVEAGDAHRVSVKREGRGYDEAHPRRRAPASY